MARAERAREPACLSPGGRTGTRPRRNLVGGFSPQKLTVGQRFDVRESEVIGIHPPAPLNVLDPAAMHSEANFARRFPWHQSSKGSESAAAIRFQSSFLERASEQAQRDTAFVTPPPTPKLVSNTRASRNSQSAMPVGSCTPNLDPRRNVMRPEHMPYGERRHAAQTRPHPPAAKSSHRLTYPLRRAPVAGSATAGQPPHRISTSLGERRVLPARSFMAIGDGSPSEVKSRAVDF